MLAQLRVAKLDVVDLADTRLQPAEGERLARLVQVAVLVGSRY